MDKVVPATGSKKGFRQPKQPTKKAKLHDMQAIVQNNQMGIRILQQVMQQSIQNNQNISQDISKMMGVLNDLQYRTLAMMEVLSIDKTALDATAEKLKIADFNEASDKEDVEKQYTVADVVTPESVVIVTSTCETSPENAIFRSKFKLSESGNKEAMELFPGKKVNDVVELPLNGHTHMVTILAIRDVCQSAPTQEGASEEVKPVDVVEEVKESPDKAE